VVMRIGTTWSWGESVETRLLWRLPSSVEGELSGVSEELSDDIARVGPERVEDSNRAGGTWRPPQVLRGHSDLKPKPRVAAAYICAVELSRMPQT
jgi:hypothetical protein